MFASDRELQVARVNVPAGPSDIGTTVICAADQFDASESDAEFFSESLPTTPSGFRDLFFLGSGTTSDVYAATAVESQAEFALKRLQTRWLNEPELVGDFLSEAAILMGIRHRHIIRCFDFFFFDQTWWLVMQRADGGSLSGVRNRSGKASEFGRRWMSEIADAIRFLHTRGIVHRDIKPANVLIHQGQAMLADFGVACRPLDSVRRKTRVCGTPRYMSPDAATGRLSPANDWFAYIQTSQDIGLTESDARQLQPGI